MKFCIPCPGILLRERKKILRIDSVRSEPCVPRECQWNLGSIKSLRDIQPSVLSHFFCSRSSPSKDAGVWDFPNVAESYSAKGKKCSKTKCPNLDRFWGSNLSTLFWKFHNVDSERLFQLFSLCKLSESETSMHALGKACGQEWSTVFDFWGENKLIKASTGPPRVNSRHLQALFDGPAKSGERPTD